MIYRPFQGSVKKKMLDSELEKKSREYSHELEKTVEGALQTAPGGYWCVSSGRSSGASGTASSFFVLQLIISVEPG
jgi:hypothetical protein